MNNMGAGGANFDKVTNGTVHHRWAQWEDSCKKKQGLRSLALQLQ